MAHPPAKEVNASSLEICSCASTDVHESASATTCSAVLPSSTLSRVIGTTSSGPLTTATPNLIVIVVLVDRALTAVGSVTLSLGSLSKDQ